MRPGGHAAIADVDANVAQIPTPGLAAVTDVDASAAQAPTPPGGPKASVGMRERFRPLPRAPAYSQRRALRR